MKDGQKVERRISSELKAGSIRRRHHLKVTGKSASGRIKKESPPQAGAESGTAAPDCQIAYRPSVALLAAGKALRDRIPRQDHGAWKRDKAKVDVLATLTHLTGKGIAPSGVQCQVCPLSSAHTGPLQPVLSFWHEGPANCV